MDDGAVGTIGIELSDRRSKFAKRVRGRFEEATGELQRWFGQLIHDECMEARGVMKRASGRVRREANR